MYLAAHLDQGRALGCSSCRRGGCSGQCAKQCSGACGGYDCGLGADDTPSTVVRWLGIAAFIGGAFYVAHVLATPVRAPRPARAGPRRF